MEQYINDEGCIINATKRAYEIIYKNQGFKLKKADSKNDNKGEADSKNKGKGAK